MEAQQTRSYISQASGTSTLKQEIAATCNQHLDTNVKHGSGKASLGVMGWT